MNSQAQHILSIATPGTLAVCSWLAFFAGAGVFALGFALYASGKTLAAAWSVTQAASAPPKP